MEENDKAPCAHHWEIERANGPTSRGICKFCRDQRDFSNTIDSLYMTGTITPSEKQTRVLPKRSVY